MVEQVTLSLVKKQRKRGWGILEEQPFIPLTWPHIPNSLLSSKNWTLATMAFTHIVLSDTVQFLCCLSLPLSLMLNNLSQNTFFWGLAFCYLFCQGPIVIGIVLRWTPSTDWLALKWLLVLLSSSLLFLPHIYYSCNTDIYNTLVYCFMIPHINF